ncbi:hypothetical protein C8J57DRAFT_1214201 [Mycena rebaudengoi]|nr:hypothetical protein C8J57DRAFT_1214201 [Mycena rebaudengoi]
MPKDAAMYCAKMARRKATRQKATFDQQNAWNQDHPVAGPSRIQLPISSEPRTLSQILASQQNTYAFPQSERGGVPLHPPRWVIENTAVNRSEEPYAAVRYTPCGSACPRVSGPPTPPQNLPLENLDPQIIHNSPQLRTRFLTRPIGELTPHTPHSRDHRDKCTRIPQSSPSSPSQPGQSMENDIHLEFVPQLLFGNRRDQTSSGGDDVGDIWVKSLIQYIHTSFGAQSLVTGFIGINLEHFVSVTNVLRFDVLGMQMSVLLLLATLHSSNWISK